MKETHSVVQWSVGGVGRQSLRALVRSPEFELLGVYSHSASRVGRDAGDLAGLDIEDGHTCHVGCRGPARAPPRLRCLHFDRRNTPQRGGGRPGRDPPIRSERRLELDDEPDLSPGGRPNARSKQLSDACAAGSSTLFTSGIDPGFSGDALPMAAFQICERVDAMRVQEICRLRQPHRRILGCPVRVRTAGGRPGPHSGARCADALLGWDGPMLSHILGVELQGLEEFCERWYTPESFDVPIGRIAKATLAAVRFGVAGHRRRRTAPVCRTRHPDASGHGPALATATAGGDLGPQGRRSKACLHSPSTSP